MKIDSDGSQSAHFRLLENWKDMAKQLLKGVLYIMTIVFILQLLPGDL